MHPRNLTLDELVNEVLSDTSATDRELYLVARLDDERATYAQELKDLNDTIETERRRAQELEYLNDAIEAEREVEVLQAIVDQADRFLDQADDLFGHSHSTRAVEWKAAYRAWRLARVGAG